MSGNRAVIWLMVHVTPIDVIDFKLMWHDAPVNARGILSWRDLSAQGHPAPKPGYNSIQVAERSRVSVAGTGIPPEKERMEIYLCAQ